MEPQWRIRDYFSDLPDDILSSLRLFHVELLRYSQELSLIPNYSEADADLLHFYESIVASKHVMERNPGLKNIFDIGSGNGFAAVVFAILYPGVQVQIVEEDLRKADFLKHIIARTEITNLSIVQVKPEKLVLKGPVIIMSRDFANLARTLLLGNKILEKDSVIYCLKDDKWFSEVAAFPSPISSTWNIEMVLETELPANLGNRVLVKAQKTK